MHVGVAVAAQIGEGKRRDVERVREVDEALVTAVVGEHVVETRVRGLLVAVLEAEQHGVPEAARVELADEGVRHKLVIKLKYRGKTRDPIIKNLKRVSRPGLRVYSNRKELPRVLGGIGIAIISTSSGIMTDRDARRQGIGGEVLCYVW